MISSSSIAPLGQLPNAPLSYVLAQVRFDPILDVEKRLPDLQSALRAIYPRFQATQGIAITIVPQGALQPQASAASLRWDFANDTNRRGVTLQQNSIALQSTEYTTHDEFSKSLAVVLKALNEVTPNLFARRVGLRYVDTIVPAAGESPNAYVRAELQCDPGPIPRMKSYQGVTAIDCEMEVGHMQIKFFTLRPNGSAPILLPPDLLPLTLEQSPIMRQVGNQQCGLLDTDRFMDIEERFDTESLIRRFNSLHEDLYEAFRISASEHGMNSWMGRGEKPTWKH